MPGRVGSHALAVDGVTPFDYALVPDHASLDITNAITLAAWVKPELVGTQDVMKKATDASINGYEITLASSGKPFVRFNQVTSVGYVTHKWSHVISGDRYHVDAHRGHVRRCDDTALHQRG